jgi:cytochrome c-type biogenesis protein CcmH/NrfG
LIRSGRNKDARKILEGSLVDLSFVPSFRYLLGQVSFSEGALSKALEHWHEFLRTAPPWDRRKEVVELAISELK